MSSPAEGIKTILDAVGTLGTLIVGDLPASPDEIGAIRQYGGLPSEFGFGVVGIKYEHPSIQIIFRGAPYDLNTPMTRARTAWATLAAVQPGSTYLIIRPQQSPFQLGRDNNQREEVACNFYVTQVPV